MKRKFPLSRYGRVPCKSGHNEAIVSFAGAYLSNPANPFIPNGSRERMVTTRVGRLTLPVPRLREGRFPTDLFDRWQRSEQALLRCRIEMVLQGVSTRKVWALVEELCRTQVSQSPVSALCPRRDPMEFDEAFSAGHRYFDMSGYWA